MVDWVKIGLTKNCCYRNGTTANREVRWHTAPTKPETVGGGAMDRQDMERQPGVLMEQVVRQVFGEYWVLAVDQTRVGFGGSCVSDVSWKEWEVDENVNWTKVVDTAAKESDTTTCQSGARER